MCPCIVHMALEGAGRLGKPATNRTVIHVGLPVATDSQFPFHKGEKLLVRIEGRSLVITSHPEQD